MVQDTGLYPAVGVESSGSSWVLWRVGYAVAGLVMPWRAGRWCGCDGSGVRWRRPLEPSPPDG